MQLPHHLQSYCKQELFHQFGSELPLTGNENFDPQNSDFLEVIIFYFHPFSFLLLPHGTLWNRFLCSLRISPPSFRCQWFLASALVWHLPLLGKKIPLPGKALACPWPCCSQGRLSSGPSRSGPMTPSITRHSFLSLLFQMSFFVLDKEKKRECQLVPTAGLSFLFHLQLW